MAMRLSRCVSKVRTATRTVRTNRVSQPRRTEPRRSFSVRPRARAVQSRQQTGLTAPRRPQQQRRRFHSHASQNTQSKWGAKLAIGAAVGVGMAWALQEEKQVFAGDTYDALRADIEAILDDYDYDDGSYGPVFVRLAWHSAGTFSQFHSPTGGSDGALMRFGPEKDDGANAGLDVPRARLEALKQKYPDVSYADLWSLASVVAIKAMGGPDVPWRPGRVDDDGNDRGCPHGRLPDAARGADHIRAVFYRMGFSDQEIVALSGAHALGRCHPDRSGFDGPWTFAPTTFSNEYFVKLLEENWVPRKWDGPFQYTDAKTKQLMMLPTDLALIQDEDFKQYVDMYARDQDKFFEDFASAYSKLLEAGVPAFQESNSGPFGCC